MNRTRRGFTLIEMLITLSMFAMLMTVLLGGLYATTRAWRRADDSMMRANRIETALRIWRDDLEHLYFEVQGGGPVFIASKDAKGETALEVRVADPDRLDAPGGSVALVRWEVGEDEQDDGRVWKRRAEYYVADRVVGEPTEEVVLEGVKSVELRFFAGGQWLETWEEKEPPELVRARVRLAGSPLSVADAVARINVGSSQ